MTEALTVTIMAWEAAATQAQHDGNPGAATIYARTAQALRQEQSTGTAVCTCCLLPYR